MEVDAYENDDFSGAMIEVDADAEEEFALEADADEEMDLDLEAEAEMEADVERRRASRAARASRAPRRAARAPRRAARRASRRASRRGGLRKLSKKLKKGAKKISAKVKRGAAKAKLRAKKLVAKAKLRAKKLVAKAKRSAKKLGVKAKRTAKKLKKGAKRFVRKLLKGKKSKKSLKGKRVSAAAKAAAAKRARMQKRIAKKRAARRAFKKLANKKFAPKVKALGNNEQAQLRQSLSKVVDAEPESAVVKVGKNWAFEDTVVSRLNKYVKMDLNELKEKEQLITKDTHDVCGMVEKSCGTTSATALSNTRTCVLTKDACYAHKISLEKVRRAQKQCDIAKKLKARTDFLGQMDYSVELAKCKAYVKSVDYYIKKGSKAFASARHAEILDADATKARVRVANAEAKIEEIQKEVKTFKAAYKACKAWVEKRKPCDEAANFGSADCALARTKASKCEAAGDLEYYKEAKDKLKAHNDQLVNLKAERDAAETAALSGGKI